VKKYERSLRAEGFEEGVERGIERINQLNIILSEQNRTNDIIRAAQDPEYQEQLFREFGLL
ncbi:MAG: hypothetical protein NC318_12220, partial [Blautia sp.]|nr:hypothetical protein [Lachnoclostridium sp.]MCM1212357.1 hypothetical protein [Blautia sp.]